MNPSTTIQVRTIEEIDADLLVTRDPVKVEDLLDERLAVMKAGKRPKPTDLPLKRATK